MKVQKVILRVMAKRLSWLQAAEILGVSPRTMRRWRWRCEQHGYGELFDRRKRRPSSKRVAAEQAEVVLGFHEKLHSEHGAADQTALR